MAGMVQVELESGESRRVCWLVLPSRVKIGDEVTLKNSEDRGRWWRIRSIGRPKDSSEIHTTWNNNI